MTLQHQTFPTGYAIDPETGEKGPLPSELAATMKKHLQRSLEDTKAALENDIQPMPKNFDPDIRLIGNKVSWQHPLFPNVGLAYTVADDMETENKLHAALRNSIWHTLELIRLGRKDELKTLGVTL